ncbi:MAG: CpsB/CapC family capsule biosynthesis tyrosine phosphatase [Thermodesulfovibrionales bacterium]
MIDLHCHVLPAIDDGPENIETSVKMLELAVSDGITHLVATPHFFFDDSISASHIDQKFRLLKEEAKLRVPGIELFSGADIRLNYELLRAIDSGHVPTINGSRYFLVELPDPVPPNTDKLLYKAGMMKFVPVITHPERNYSLLSSPEKVDTLRNTGALFQLTAMSLTGDFGGAIQKFSHGLLRKGIVEFIASDAHNTGSRPPLLSAAYKMISGLFGSKTAGRLFIGNPSAVLENRQLL